MPLRSIRHSAEFLYPSIFCNWWNTLFSNSSPWSECRISGGPKIPTMRSVIACETTRADLFVIGVRLANLVRWSIVVRTYFHFTPVAKTDSDVPVPTRYITKRWPPVGHPSLAHYVWVVLTKNLLYLVIYFGSVGLHDSCKTREKCWSRLISQERYVSALVLWYRLGWSRIGVCWLQKRHQSRPYFFYTS